MSRKEFSFKIGGVTVCFVEMYHDCWICSLPEAVARQIRMHISPYRFVQIDDLELSAKAANALFKAGHKTVADILDLDVPLRSYIGIGKKGSKEIVDKLSQYNIPNEQLEKLL